MRTGTIKFFNETKGFGFIIDTNSNEQIFFHVSGLKDEVREGNSVTFEVEEGRKGPNAVQVRLAQ